MLLPGKAGSFLLSFPVATPSALAAAVPTVVLQGRSPMLGPMEAHRAQWGLNFWKPGVGALGTEMRNHMLFLQTLRRLPSCCWNPVCREQGRQLEL